MRKIIALLTVLFLLVWSAYGIGFDWKAFGDIGNTVKFVGKQWFPLDWSEAATP